MKFSIVTPTYNSEATIADTMRSIQNQTYADIEHIVIDGGSTDATLALLRSMNPEARIVSESDNGIYDAMNKGIRMATGEIIYILNSDDWLASETIIQDIAERFHSTGSNIVYGDIAMVAHRDEKSITRRWSAGSFEQSRLKWGWAPPHPGVFVRRSLYEQQGMFNLEFRIAADYEWMLRIFSRSDIKIDYMPALVAFMREGGASGSSLKNRIKGWQEIRRALKLHGYLGSWFVIIIRVFLKAFQYRMS